MDKILSHLPYILLNLFLVVIMLLLLAIVCAFMRFIFETIFRKLKITNKIRFLPWIAGVAVGALFWIGLIILSNNFFFPLRPTLVGWTAQKLQKGLHSAGIEVQVEKRPMKWPFGPG